MDKTERSTPLSELTRMMMEKIREVVDSNVIVGQPITTPDGVTLIPISRVNFGFGNGGGDYGKTTATQGFGGGSGAGVKIDPVAFLMTKDGVTRVLPVAVPPASTVDRVIDMVPEVMDKVEKYFDKKKEKDLG